MASLADGTVALSILLAAIAGVMTIISIVSWRRTGHARLLWIALGFVGLAIQGAWYLRWAMQNRSGLAMGDEPFPVLLGLDLAVVVALYLAVLRR